MKIPILLYHSIAQDVAPQYQRWALSPAKFNTQMEILLEQNYTPITAGQLVSALTGINPNLPDKPVVITFDDGLIDFYANALPVLLEYGYPATLFIATAYIGGASLWLASKRASNYTVLTWEQISEIASVGVDIGSHGHSHRQLDTLLLHEARDEIVRSRELLEDHLGKPVDCFAYPYGYFSSAVRELLPQAGYKAAFAVKHAISSLTDDRYALARIVVTAEISHDQFCRLLNGDGLRTAPFDERLQTKAWRAVRRTSTVFKRGLST